MAHNPEGMCKIDPNQIIRLEHCAEHHAKRVMLAVPLELQISLSHKEGDSVMSHLPSLALKGTTAQTEVIPPTSCVGIKEFGLYSSTKVLFQISPSDTDDYWVDYTPGSIGRRIRVVLDPTQTPETPSNVYLVGQG